MESFLHLLIWFAIRFLPHNCKRVGDFVVEYFDDYQKADGEYYCGTAKKMAMNTGKIGLPRGEALTFLRPEAVSNLAAARSSRILPAHLHPINALVREYLGFLRSHYTLRSLEQEVTTDNLVRDTEAGDEWEQGEQWFSERGLTEVPEEGDEEKGEEKEESMMETITPEQMKKHEANAAKLAQQEVLVDLFGKYFMNKTLGWPRDDKLPDQLDKDYRRLKDDGPVPTGSKRASLHDSQFDGSDGPPAKRRSARHGGHS